MVAPKWLLITVPSLACLAAMYACSSSPSAGAPSGADASSSDGATQPASDGADNADGGDANAADAFSANVRDYGAKGDGTTDDQPAVNAAVAALQARGGNGTLYFPAGQYRVEKQAAPQSAVYFKDVVNLTVRFDAGAVLSLDNLDTKGEGSQGHGIFFQGACRHIRLENVHVAWASLPSRRSFGDGIHIDGFPSDALSAADVHILGATVERAPQAGIILMGVSDVEVRNATVTDTLADGLHFNACRRVMVDTYDATRTGDDALAFVTYYDPSTVYLHKSGDEGPYAQPGLGDWSDTDSTAAHIHVSGGHANGCRIDSALRVHVSDLTVEGRAGEGLMVDATEATDGGADGGDDADGGDGGTLNWNVIASRGVVVDGLNVSSSTRGFLVVHQGGKGNPFGSPPAFWQFDVTVNDVTVNDNKGDPYPGGYLNHVTGATVNRITGNDATQTAVVDSPDSGIHP